MKRLHIAWHVVWIMSIGVALLSGCASKKSSVGGMTVQPYPYVLMPDTSGNVRMDVTFQVPEHYLNRRSRLVITPQLLINGQVWEELLPVVVDAPIYEKKLRRKEVIEGYQDSYESFIRKVSDVSGAFGLPYQETFALPVEMENGNVRAVVSSDGCGECTGIDTIEVALFSNPLTLIDVRKGMRLAWMEPEFVIRPKVHEGRGEARLQFLINRYDINLELGNNRQEMEAMTKALRPVLADTLAEVRSFRIDGMASADGSFAFNTTLARNRAASAKQWLVDELAIRPQVQRLIRIGSRPEGWWPVYEAMVADGHPDTLAVKRILTRYTTGNDDVQERYIRRLPCWTDIKEKYLQKDRKVEYVYSYTIRSFTTDKELLAMYRVRPDAFNEDELLRVASLADTDSRKMEVYRTLMMYFPQSQVAANNLAVLYLRSGEEDKACQVFDRLDSHSPEAINTQAVAYAYAGDYERAIELLQGVELPEARYNLGLLKAQQRKSAEAYRLLKNYHDVNAALVTLSVSRTEEAKAMMDGLEEETPLVEYVRALIAARLRDDSAFYLHLRKACLQENLRSRAVGEPEFIYYRNERMFREIVE